MIFIIFYSTVCIYFSLELIYTFLNGTKKCGFLPVPDLAGSLQSEKYKWVPTKSKINTYDFTILALSKLEQRNYNDFRFWRCLCRSGYRRIDVDEQWQ